MQQGNVSGFYFQLSTLNIFKFWTYPLDDHGVLLHDSKWGVL